MKVPIMDQRTGKKYEGFDNGHGTECTCTPCLMATMSDMVEAGIMEIVGFDGTEPIIQLTEKYR